MSNKTKGAVKGADLDTVEKMVQNGETFNSITKKSQIAYWIITALIAIVLYVAARAIMPGQGFLAWAGVAIAAIIGAIVPKLLNKAVATIFSSLKGKLSDGKLSKQEMRELVAELRALRAEKASLEAPSPSDK